MLCRFCNIVCVEKEMGKSANKWYLFNLFPFDLYGSQLICCVFFVGCVGKLRKIRWIWSFSRVLSYVQTRWIVSDGPKCLFWVKKTGFLMISRKKLREFFKLFCFFSSLIHFNVPLLFPFTSTSISIPSLISATKKTISMSKLIEIFRQSQCHEPKSHCFSFPFANFLFQAISTMHFAAAFFP